ncbi:MAG: amidohydrolase family protein [Rhodospirillales bacterium]|nr:amidohydrolase family protein [Rhodospirillales bacterium]
MNVALLDRTTSQNAIQAVIDCDVHQAARSIADLRPHLSERWWRHIETYGLRRRLGPALGPAYPKGQPGAMRRDAWPEGGGRAGSDLGLMQRQHLDANHVAFAILNPLTPTGEGMQNPEFSAALCTAVNRWQVDAWTSRDARLRASIVVPYEDGPAAAAEIERWAGDPNFAQVLLLSRTAEPLGQRRYWPIYEAAERAGLPVGIHAFGYGGQPITGSGWPSFYLEEMVGHAQCAAALLTSLVMEGVFARYPRLAVVLTEAGFAWIPSLLWRLDKLWQRMRDEVPDVAEPPSTTVRRQVWLTTQPMEEPEHRWHFRDIVEWIGTDRLLFASDYPHWDFDDPAQAFPVALSPEVRESIAFANAARLYRLR